MSNRFYEKHSEWLIPVLCVLVIFQAIMLVSDNSLLLNMPGESSGTTVGGQEQTQPVNQLVFVPESVAAVKGEPIQVEIWLKPSEQISLGGMDLVFRFDPKVVSLTKVEAQDELFSFVSINRQSEKTGRLFVTYLDDTKGGLVVGEDQKLLSLTMTAKQSGQIDLGLVTGGEGARTVLTDKTTNQYLPISVGSLVITVTED